MKGVATKGNTITYGAYGLVAQEWDGSPLIRSEAARGHDKILSKEAVKYILKFSHTNR